MYYSFFTSELITFITNEEVERDDDRPDIALVFSNNPSENKPFDVVIVELKKRGFYAIHSDGTAEGNWILIDYDDFVIHIFTEEIRQFYDLERLWKDAGEIRWE